MPSDHPFPPGVARMTPFLMAAAVLCAHAASPMHESDLVFAPERFHNHSSSIVETPKGDLLVCWFHGHGEKSDDTLVIRGARRRSGARDWSAPFVLADSPNLPDQNCVLFVDPQGTLWLFWISSLDNTSRTFLLKYRTSTDYEGHGPPRWAWESVLHCRPTNLAERLAERIPQAERVFSEAHDGFDRLRTRNRVALEASKDKLWRRLGWMTRANPIMLSETRMMLPLYSDHFLCSLAAFTDDGGKTWTFSEPILAFNVQPAFVQRKNGDIVAYMRDKSPHRRIPQSISTNGGLTWSVAEPMAIANPNSSVACIALECGRWVLVGNDTEGGPRGGRTRLTAYLSDDEGVTWNWKRHLEDHDASTAAAYPSLIQARDGSIHCTYTFSPEPNETIKHVRFNAAWIRTGN